VSVKRALWKMAWSLARDRKAGTAIEYGLIAALIVIAMIVSFTRVANVTVGMWNNVSTTVQAAH
jgi:pilus assembly protein Flp/PilA